MPKKVMTALEDEKREQFKDALKKSYGNVSEACYELGISRQTGHRWIEKWRLGGYVQAQKDLARFDRYYDDDEE